MTEPVTDAYRSGFVSFVGRPNAGKSTLTNALVGQKVVITSDKPQTTRTVVRGIVNRPDAQLILVDTPGCTGPRTLLGERLNDLVKHDAGRGRRGRGVLPGEREDRTRRPVHRAGDGEGTPHAQGGGRHQDRPRDPDRIGQHLLDIAALGDATRTTWAEVVPVSAVAGNQTGLLADLLVALLPEGPQLYPDGDLTDAPEEILVAELIREAALDGVRDELPHSIAVVVEEMGLRENRPGTSRCSTSTPTCTSNGRRRRASSSATRAPGCATSAPAHATRSRPSSARRCTSTCTSRSPRTGSGTRSSSASSAFEPPAGRGGTKSRHETA